MARVNRWYTRDFAHVCKGIRRLWCSHTILWCVAHNVLRRQPRALGSCIMSMQVGAFMYKHHTYKDHFGVLLICVVSLLDNTWTHHEIALMWPWIFIHGCGWNVVTWFIQHMTYCAVNLCHWSVAIGVDQEWMHSICSACSVHDPGDCMLDGLLVKRIMMCAVHHGSDVYGRCVLHQHHDGVLFVQGSNKGIIWGYLQPSFMRMHEDMVCKCYGSWMWCIPHNACIKALE